MARGFIHYEDYYGSVSDAVARTAIGRMLFYQVLSHFGFVDIPGRKTAADINNRLLRWIDTVEGRPFFAFANYLLDEDALVAALEAGRIAGAGLDVFADEPRVPSALLERDDVVLLPHVGSATVETREAMGRLVLDNVDAFLERGELVTPVG